MTSDALLSNSNVPTETTDNEIPVISPDRQFIQLALEVETPILLSVLNLFEILTISTSQVVPMFQMPPWVIGVYNWRGDILWVVDLNHLVGFSPWYQQKNYVSKHTVVVLKGQSEQSPSQVKASVLGLVVNQVSDMAICEPELIQAITNLEIPETIRPFLGGYWQGDTSKDHWILNGEAVLNAMTMADQPITR
ncbi:MAG: chemotaxis protein CheW [Cyanobacteria bacterium P01_D01_bin.156]